MISKTLLTFDYYSLSGDVGRAVLSCSNRGAKQAHQYSMPALRPQMCRVRGGLIEGNDHTVVLKHIVKPVETVQRSLNRSGLVVFWGVNPRVDLVTT